MKTHKETLEKYIGLMEQLITNNPEIFDKDDDNLDDYNDAVWVLNKINLDIPGTQWYCNLSIKLTIEEIKNELPF